MNPRITRQVIGATAAALVFGGALATAQQHADDAQLLSKLSSSHLTLVDGIRQAEKSDGPAISAKFEMKEGQLLLSVYKREPCTPPFQRCRAHAPW